MLERLEQDSKNVRLWSYGILVSVFLTFFIASIAADRADLRLLAISGGIVLVLACGLEALLLVARRRSDRILFAESQNDLFHRLGGLAQFIARSKEIDILAGTGLALTQEDANLRALDQSLDRGARVRILLMHAEGEGVRAETYSRRARYVATPDDELPSEVRKSLKRIAEHCQDVRAVKIVRLYRGSRTLSMYRFDGDFLVTLNTGGRGSSAPALFVRSSPQRRAFCRNLVRGFEEIWDSAAAEVVDHAYLLELRSTAVGAPVPMPPRAADSDPRASSSQA